MKTKLISITSVCVLFIVVGLILKNHHNSPELTDKQLVKLGESTKAYFDYKRQEAISKQQVDQKESTQTQQKNASAMPPKQEKLDEFIELKLSDSWKKLENNSPMASGKLELTLDGKAYDTVVLRMPINVPVETVINIWRQRLGVSGEKKLEYKKLMSNSNQEWQLTSLSGDKQQALIAFNTGKTRYTFFRLSSESEISASVENAFLELLKQSTITQL
jgi:hypothetical protein